MTVERVIVFNPNTDNSLLMRGDPEAANAIWLLNWRKALEKRQEDGRPLRANNRPRWRS